jgi:hypothetical protein
LSEGYLLRWQTSRELARAKVALGAKLQRVKPMRAA